MKISAYKSPKTDELYLFIPEEVAPDTLPNELLVFFGEPQHVIDFELTPERKLARANPQEVLESIQSKGYYLQTPPSEKEKVADITLPDLTFDKAPD